MDVPNFIPLVAVSAARSNQRKTLTAILCGTARPAAPLIAPVSNLPWALSLDDEVRPWALLPPWGSSPHGLVYLFWPLTTNGEADERPKTYQYAGKR